MATRPKKVTMDTNAVNIVNALRNNNSNYYKEYVPPITDVTDLRAIGKIIMDMPALQNEFISSLVNRIALVRITSKMFENPWTRFKKGFLEFGEVIEDVFVDLTKVYEFDPLGTSILASYAVSISLVVVAALVAFHLKM